jgi:hypothetical protein
MNHLLNKIKHFHILLVLTTSQVIQKKNIKYLSIKKNLNQIMNKWYIKIFIQKSSLQSVNSNIGNYKNEITKLEDLLIGINEHENNFKILIKNYQNLKKLLEETIEIESLIEKLSSNQ